VIPITTIRRLQRLEEAAPPLRMTRPPGLEGDAYCEFVLAQARADIGNRAMPHVEVRRRWHGWLDTLTREEDASPFWADQMARLKADIATEKGSRT
jgi:hypothetical protein